MRTKISKIFILFFLVLVIFFVWYFWDNNNKINAENNGADIKNTKPQEEVVEKPKDIVKKIKVKDGSTYSKLMKEAGVDYADSDAIYQAAKDLYDLAKIRLGRTLDLTYDAQSQKFKKLSYQIDTEEELIVENTEFYPNKQATSSKWVAERKKIEYELREKVVSGKIKNSLYQSALDAGVDIRAIIELANAFQWTIDFAMDTREGDEYKFVYNERYLDGKYIMPGQILAGRYTNAGKDYFVYYFEESDDNKGYFDENGNSVQKMFLKAPVAFKYISSGFTTGRRYVSAFHAFTKSHRAIDYAAAIGTPIRAVGDGVITAAYYSRVGYGNLLSIRHNATYSTNYAHLSRFAVKVGQRVKQGQVVGYVGSTGYSTGPHLHFEMVKNGVKINPLREVLPPGKPIKEENKQRFLEVVEKYKKEIER